MFEPDPGSQAEVHVGDVGYIHYGAFERLFNIFLPADDPIHHTFGVPENFQPLPRSQQTVRERNPLPRGEMVSKTVCRIGVVTNAYVPL